MDIVLFVALFLLMFAFCFGCNFIDQKYNLQLADWFSGKTDSPFNQGRENYGESTANPIHKNSDEEINSLKARVATLEKIITDNAYELNEQIRKLK